MDITFVCNKCGQKIVIDEVGAGQFVNCPKCQVPLRVPVKHAPTPVTTPVTPALSNLVKCPDCSREVSKRATSCPHCGAPIAPAAPPPQPTTASVMACPSCRVQLVSKEKTKGGATLSGVLGLFLLISGVLAVFANVIVGGILIIAGILLGVGFRGKETVLVCPKCKKEVAKV